VAAGQGGVHVDDPGSVAVSMTPDAARKTAERLAVAVGEADDQDADDVYPDVATIEDIHAARHRFDHLARIPGSWFLGRATMMSRRPDHIS
jgi:hypothetical protein